MDDSILLNAQPEYEFFDLDYIYDHRKMKKATPLTREALKEKINDSNTSSNTHESAIQLLYKLTLLTSADVGVQLVTLFVNTFDTLNESPLITKYHDAI